MSKQMKLKQSITKKVLMLTSVGFAVAACGIERAASPPDIEVRGARTVAVGQSVTFTVAVTSAEGKETSSETFTRPALALRTGNLGKVVQVPSQVLGDAIAGMLIVTDQDHLRAFKQQINATSSTGLPIRLQAESNVAGPPTRVHLSAVHGSDILLDRDLQRRANGWVASRVRIRVFHGSQLRSTITATVIELGEPAELVPAKSQASAPADVVLSSVTDGCDPEAVDDGSGQAGAWCISEGLAVAAAAGAVAAIHVQIAGFAAIHDWVSVTNLQNNVLPGARTSLECAQDIFNRCMGRPC